jgi:TP901 family phage tail tape measure protein
MADVTKTVEIALKIVGVDLNKINSVISVFNTLQKSVNSVTKSVDTFKKSLESIKQPPALTKVVSSLQKVSKVKTTNLTNISKGFEKLGKIKVPPDFSGFVKQLQKLARIKSSGISRLAAALQKLMKTSLSGFAMKVTTLETGLRRLAAINVANITAALKVMAGINLSKATSETKKLKEVIKDTGTVAGDSGFRVRTFADKVKTVLQFRFISDVLVRLKESIAAGITAIIEYDQALKDLQAITGATTLEVAQMGIKILEVASTTKFSASEVAAGMRTIGQAGFSASEAVETMQAVSDLATGTLSDMATTVDLVTTAMRVFQIEATESGKVSDTLANAVNKSKLTVDKLRTAMNYIGPIAKSAGVSFTELAASMGTLANSGIRASTIGTGLRRVFAELVDPSKKLAAAAKEAGVALNELDPRATSLSRVISNLSLVVDDTQLAFALFGKRGAAAALALTSTGVGFASMLDLVGRTGTAAEMAAIQMEGLGVSFKNLKDKLGLLAIAIGETGIAGAMRILINIARDLVDVFTSLASTALVKFIVQVTLVVASIYTLVGAFYVLKIALSSVVAMKIVAFFASVTASIKVLIASVIALDVALWPIVAVLGAIIAIGAGAFYLLSDGAKEASEEALLLADKYDILEKRLRDYGKATVNLEEDSNKLKEANIKLRTELFEVASGYGKVAELALKAAESIDPLEGKFTDGKKALQEYNDVLNEFQTDALVEALNKANESFDTQTDNLHRWTRQVQMWFDQTLVYAKAFSGTFYDLLNFDFSNIPKRFIKAWKDVQNSKKEAEEAMDLSKGINKNTKSFQDLADAVKSFDMTDLTREQEVQIALYESLNEKAVKFVQHLKDTGQVSLKDTLENLEKFAKKTGATGINLQAVVVEFGRLKKAAADTFSNIVEKWKADDDPKFLTNLVDGFTELGGVISKTDESALLQIESQRQLRINQLNELKETVKEAKESGENMEKFWGEYYTKEQAILTAASEDRKKLAKNKTAQQLVDYAIELKNLDAHLATITETWKYNEDERGKAIAEARAKAQKRIDDIILGVESLDLKVQDRLYKENLELRETFHAEHIANIERREALRLLTEEDANKERLALDVAYYDKSLALAIEYLSKVSKEDDPAIYAKRLRIKEDVEQKSYSIRTKYLQKYSDDSTKIQEKIIKSDEKVTDENIKNSKKIETAKSSLLEKLLSLETSYSAKVKAIADTLRDKLKVIDDKIADNRKAAVSDILRLVSSTEEKIRNVYKKGMTEEEQIESDVFAAKKYYSEGVLLIKEAELEKDQEKLAAGVELIKQAETLSDAITDERRSVNFLKKTLETLKGARNIEAELVELDLLQKKTEEVAKAAEKEADAKKSYDAKTTAARSHYDQVIDLENTRHANEMQNLSLELAKQLEKLVAIYKVLDLATGGDHTKEIKGIQLEITELQKKQDLIKKTNEIVRKAKVYKVTGEDGIASFTELSNSIGEIIETIGEDGTRSFTVINDQAEETFANINKYGERAFDSILEKAEEVGEGIDKALTSDEITKIIENNFGAIEGAGVDAFDSTTDAAKKLDTAVNDMDLTIDPKVDEGNKVTQFKTAFESIVTKAIELIINIPQLDMFNQFKLNWDELKSKSITLTTKYVEEAKQAAKELARGGRLPGFGGGDRRHILGEDGEWMINKYAVRKYGDDFMANLNNMALPKFAAGGPISEVGSSDSSGASETLIVRFQVGDMEAPIKITDPNSRSTMKLLANELSKMRLSYAR